MDEDKHQIGLKVTKKSNLSSSIMLFIKTKKSLSYRVTVADFDYHARFLYLIMTFKI